jgi:hypothetical protein
VKHYFGTTAALAVSLMSSAVVPALMADESDKKTNITIDRSIDVQGTVLPAGSYVMTRAGSSPNGHIVQIYRADDNHLVAIVQAIPAYRLATTPDPQLKFYAETESGTPALRTWFYPGDNFGVEFRPGRGEAATQSAGPHTNGTTSSAGGN